MKMIFNFLRIKNDLRPQVPHLRIDCMCYRIQRFYLFQTRIQRWGWKVNCDHDYDLAVHVDTRVRAIVCKQCGHVKDTLKNMVKNIKSLSEEERKHLFKKLYDDSK